MSRDLANEVDQALREDKYDLPLFMRFLKSFMIEGTQPDKRLLLGSLLQALPRFHTSDFSACISLVQGHVQDASYIEKELGIIYDFENYLTCGKFVQFWKEWNASKDLLPVAPSFEPQVRASILIVISTTLESVPVAKMAQYLNVELSQVAAAVKSAEEIAGDAVRVTECNAETVTFAITPFNVPESDSIQRPQKFSDIITIVS